MKQLLIVSIFLVSAFGYHIEPQINAEAHIDPRIFEDLINSTIEGFRPEIPNPIEIDNLVLALPDEPDALATGNASISNFKLSGLEGFQLTALNFALIGTKLNFTLDLPVIDLYTDFGLHLLLANTLALYGDGNVTVHLEDLDIQVSAQANLTGGISLANLRVSIYLGASTFEIHGLLDDEEVSSLLSSILNDLVSKLLDENQELITQVLSPIIETLINAVLGSLGQTTTTAP